MKNIHNFNEYISENYNSTKNVDEALTSYASYGDNGNNNNTSRLSYNDKHYFKKVPYNYSEQHRGKSIDDDKWIYGTVSVSDDRLYINNQEIKPDTCDQCIYIKDCKETMIYENDVIRFYSTKADIRDGMPFYTQYLIKYNGEYNNFWCYDKKDSVSRLCNISNIDDGLVVGNIHDNPELKNHLTYIDTETYKFITD